MATRMQQRRGTAAEWAAQNPVLADGELGFVRDTKDFKLGDGLTAWNALPSAHIPPSIFDVKGDLIAGTADNAYARLAVGGDGAALIADSSQAVGMAWSNVMKAPSASTVAFTGKGAVGQTADIFNIQNSAAAVPLRTSSAGTTFAQQIAGGVTPFVVKAVASPSSDLIMLQNSSGAALAGWGSTGQMALGDSPNAAGQAGWLYINNKSGGAGNGGAGKYLIRGYMNTGQTANAIDVLSEAAVTQFWVASDGSVATRNSVQAWGWSTHGTSARYGTSIVSVNTGAAGNFAMVLRGVTSQSADYIQTQDSAGVPITKLSAGGTLTTPVLSLGNGPNTGASLFGQIPAGQSAGVAFMLIRDNGGNDIFRVMPRGGTWIGVNNNAETALTLKNFLGQTVDAFQVQSSTGATLAKFDKIGRLLVNPANIASFDQSTIDAAVMIGASSTADRNLVMRSISGTTVNMTEWQNATPTVVAAVTSTGNVQGTGAYTTLSDASVKSNVRDLPLDPMAVVRRLRPRHFDYVYAESDQVGFVAQEVEAVLPHAVVPFDTLPGGIPDYEGRQGLRTEAILAYLVAAVQDIDRRLVAA